MHVKNLFSRFALAAKPKTQDAPAASLFTAVALEQVVSQLARLADPDQVLAKVGIGRHELRKLETDDEISAAIETRREAVTATPWKLEPFDAQLVEELAPHMDDLLRGAWTAVPYGYSVLEVVYRPGPPIGIASIQEKPVEWFEPTRDGRLKYTAPTGGAQAVEVDTRYKFLLTRRNPTYRNPYGEALLSRAYWPWFFRYNGWRFWMRFLERFADPLLLGKVRDPVSFVTAMQGMGLEAIVGVGHDEDVSAVTPALAGEFERADNALCRRIQKLILGQTLTTDVGTTGSYAAAEVHNAVREDKRRADIRLIASTAQRLVDALWALNGKALPAPRIVMQDDTGLESARATRDSMLVEKGVLELTKDYLLDRYDFRDGDFTIPSKAPGSAQAKLAAPIPGVRVGQRFSADQEMVEDLISETTAQATSPIPASALKAEILAAESPEDLSGRLAALYHGHDAAEFRDLMERALFVSDVLGFSTSAKRIGQ